MAGENLRDRGYPQARNTQNFSAKRNMPMTNDIWQTGEGFWAQAQPLKVAEPVDRTTALDRLVTAYNSRAFANPSMPLVNKSRYDYVDDNTDSRAINNALSLYSRDNNRLGTLVKNVVDDGGTYYGAAIDNLAPILGDRDFYKELNTPIGTLSAEYDGDTLSGGLDVPIKNYYLVALKNLLNRGTL